jgi:hypothetical protein
MFTRFDEKQRAVDYFGEQLVRAGYNYYGNEIMYSGVSGTEMTCEIYFGVCHGWVKRVSCATTEQATQRSFSLSLSLSPSLPPSCLSVWVWLFAMHRTCWQCIGGILSTFASHGERQVSSAFHWSEPQPYAPASQGS